jgi:hypothetical protein
MRTQISSRGLNLALVREPIDYDAVERVITRRGLSEVYAELLTVLGAVLIQVLRKRNANGAADIRERIDAQFAAMGGWQKTQVGGVDWVKEVTLESGASVAHAALGVEIQVSGRSTMLYRDVSHLRESLSHAKIDAGVIVVPDDELSVYLTDRAPSLREALETIKDVRADQVPIRLLPIGLDSFGEQAIPKKRTNLGRGDLE